MWVISMSESGFEEEPVRPVTPFHCGVSFCAVQEKCDDIRVMYSSVSRGTADLQCNFALPSSVTSSSSSMYAMMGMSIGVDGWRDAGRREVW
jgi:hypothetical protein